MRLSLLCVRPSSPILFSIIFTKNFRGTRKNVHKKLRRLLTVSMRRLQRAQCTQLARKKQSDCQREHKKHFKSFTLISSPFEILYCDDYFKIVTIVQYLVYYNYKRKQKRGLLLLYAQVYLSNCSLGHFPICKSDPT